MPWFCITFLKEETFIVNFELYTPVKSETLVVKSLENLLFPEEDHDIPSKKTLPSKGKSFNSLLFASCLLLILFLFYFLIYS